MHEIRHALGKWHEQKRADRDSQIRILYENLGPYVTQFNKLGTVNYGVPYDPESVVHYSPKVCSNFCASDMKKAKQGFIIEIFTPSGRSYCYTVCVSLWLSVCPFGIKLLNTLIQKLYFRMVGYLDHI